MTELVVMVEEESARIVVETLLQRMLPDRGVIVVPHRGRSDLRASVPRKLAAWKHPPDVPFLILHDNDRSICMDLKKELIALLPPNARNRTRIRIVMQELESWYLGDFPALCAAGLMSQKKARDLERSAKFRDPDAVAHPKSEFFKLHDDVGQIALARRIAPHLDPRNNRSRSFQLFVRTIDALIP